MLRVMNDDLVQPDRGFGTHPHANMEICTCAKIFQEERRRNGRSPVVWLRIILCCTQLHLSFFLRPLSYVVEGELTHRDSMGTGETLGRGIWQRGTIAGGKGDWPFLTICRSAY